jgi:hypothetical protein
LKLLPYLAQTLTRRGPYPTKFPVLSSKRHYNRM